MSVRQAVMFARRHAKAVYDEKAEKDALIKKLIKKGWRKIGVGSFSYVLSHPRYDTVVLKVSSTASCRSYFRYTDGWSELCFWMIEDGVRSKHAPRVYWIEGPRHAPVFITVVERLYPLKDEDVLFDLEMSSLSAKYGSPKPNITRTTGSRVKERQILFAFKLMQNIRTSLPLAIFDIHRDNIMMRQDGTPVISDPIVFD